MKLVFLGPPGAGKGTQASKVAEYYKIPKISTGDLLRTAVAEESDLGLKAKEYMKKGVLVPDDLVDELVRERLNAKDCKDGFLLDGYPRNLKQAQSLEAFTDIDFVIYIDVPAEVLIARLTGRRTCRKCNTIYHVVTNPPKEEGICDLCNGSLYQRFDDKEETVRKRLEIYAAETAPLINYYRDLKKVYTIDGSGSIEKVYELLIGCLQKVNKKQISQA